MNEHIGTRMMAAKTQHLKEQQSARSIALHKFNCATERRRQHKIAGSVIVLFALIIANAWAFKQGWGL
jgi:hypothetical protein